MPVIGRGVPNVYPVSQQDENRLVLPPRPPLKVDVSDMAFRGPMSQFVEEYLTIEGAPFSFDGREYLRPIHDESYPNSQRIILKTGRQVEKSSTLAMKLISHCAVHPWFKTLYVSPSQMQTRQFSADRVRASYDRSPKVKKLFEGKGVTDQVFDKRLLNGSMMYFRYAFLHPDRCRGLSADLLTIDEIQDILTDNIPVIRECLSHSSFKKEVYSGTPKTTSNAIEFYWDKSTQNEWLVKCQWCNYWNMLGMDNIGEHAIVCSKCQKPLNPRIGQWVTMCADAKWEGFRIPQLMVPWVTFDEIKSKLDDYPTSKFYNEVLGLPYDSGVKPITESQLRSCCNYGNIMDPPDPLKIRGPIFAGIDWGTGGVSGEENPSYSVLSFGAYFNPNVFTIFYMKKFIGREADLLKITSIIGQLFQQPWLRQYTQHGAWAPTRTWKERPSLIRPAGVSSWQRKTSEK